MCIDLNTMEVVWVQDTIDDTNASPVFEVNEEDGVACTPPETILTVSQEYGISHTISPVAALILNNLISPLFQGKIIYEYGYDDEFSVREDNNRFHAYDSSPLIDVETDTLIQPGENGA